MEANCGDVLKDVLRGGSWNNNERNARCAYRNRNNPNNRNNNVGFRVVVLTFFPSIRGCRKCSPDRFAWSWLPRSGRTAERIPGRAGG